MDLELQLAEWEGLAAVCPVLHEACKSGKLPAFDINLDKVDKMMALAKKRRRVRDARNNTRSRVHCPHRFGTLKLIGSTLAAMGHPIYAHPCLRENMHGNVFSIATGRWK